MLGYWTTKSAKTTHPYLYLSLDTTRPIRPGEVNGHDYHFVTREEFEREVQLDQFLEYGELRGHYYGTSFSSIKKVAESGRVPVLDLSPQVIAYSCVCSMQIERYKISKSQIQYVPVLGVQF